MPWLPSVNRISDSWLSWFTAFRKAGLKVSPWLRVLSATQSLPSRRSTPPSSVLRKRSIRPVSRRINAASIGSEASLFPAAKG